MFKRLDISFRETRANKTGSATAFMIIQQDSLPCSAEWLASITHLFPEKDMQASLCSPYQHPQQPTASVTYALCSSQDKNLLDSLYRSIFLSKSVLTIVSSDVFERSK